VESILFVVAKNGWRGLRFRFGTEQPNSLAKALDHISRPEVVSAKTEVTKTETETTAVCRAGVKKVFFFLGCFFRER
jgi:hypothetical protein